MKNLFAGIHIILCILFFSSCDSSNKPAENQTVGSSNKQAPDSAQRAERQANQKNESMTGEQLVEKASSKLTNRLGLTAQQVTSLKDILTKSFLASGEDLNKVYNGEQAKTMGLELIQKSNASILAILDAGQKEKFGMIESHE